MNLEFVIAAGRFLCENKSFIIYFKNSAVLNNWYFTCAMILHKNTNSIIWRVYKKTIYIHMYPSTYGLHAYMIFPKHIMLHILDGNYKLTYLQFLSQPLCYMWGHIRN